MVHVVAVMQDTQNLDTVCDNPIYEEVARGLRTTLRNTFATESQMIGVDTGQEVFAVFRPRLKVILIRSASACATSEEHRRLIGIILRIDRVN